MNTSITQNNQNDKQISKSIRRFLHVSTFRLLWKLQTHIKRRKLLQQKCFNISFC